MLRALLPQPPRPPCDVLGFRKEGKKQQRPSSTFSPGAQQPKREGVLQTLLPVRAQCARGHLPKGLRGGQWGEVSPGLWGADRRVGEPTRAVPMVEGLPKYQGRSSSYCRLPLPGSAERSPSLWLPAKIVRSLFTSIRISPTPTRASWPSTCPMTPVIVSNCFRRGSLAGGGGQDALSTLHASSS